MRMGTVSSRVALLLRSAEVKPFSQRFVQLELVGLLFFFFYLGRCFPFFLCQNFYLRASQYPNRWPGYLERCFPFFFVPKFLLEGWSSPIGGQCMYVPCKLSISPHA